MRRLMLVVAIVTAAGTAWAEWPPPAYDKPSSVVMIPQCRWIDTRIPGPALGEFPKQGEPYPLGGPLEDGVTRGYLLQGGMWCPSDHSRDLNIPLLSTAVMVNITAVNATGPGWLLAHDPNVYPMPLGSTLNFRPDRPSSGFAIVALGQLVGANVGDPFWADFAIHAYVAGGGTVDVVVDVVGYLSPLVP